MEGHFGVTVDFITFPDETKAKLLQMRNDKIKEGEQAFTITDVLVWSVNVAHQMHQMQKQNSKLQENRNAGKPRTS